MPTLGDTSLNSPEVGGACVNCGTMTKRIDEYALDIAGEEVMFYADRCPSCGSEFVNAPKILRSDAEMIEQFRPESSALGSFTRVLNLSSRDRELRQYPGDRVAGTLLWYLLEEDMADVVFLAHQSVTEEPVMAYTKKDLFKAWQIRMGASRAIVTGSGLRANLLTLTQLKRFTEMDRGLHPRIAVMGRPCQVYTVRKLLWDTFAPGYDFAFGMGTFCYGNFAPGAWGGQKLREILGFDPADIRQVKYVGEELEFIPSEGEGKKVGQEDVAGLVNANCLQCYDFTARFSDLSVGHVGREDLFEAVLVRTEKGGVVLDQAIRDGFLAPSTQLYGKVDVSEEEQRTLSYLNAMVGIKKELTGKLR